MELLKDNLHVYFDSLDSNGRWIPAKVIVNSFGVVEVIPQNQSKKDYSLSSNWIVQAPNDTVWHKVPPLPFQRSVRETFSLNEKKGKAIWFLTLSEHDRNKWFTVLAPFTQRKPLPYGDYDNWSYPQDELEADSKCLRSFQAPLSLTPQHRSGFYSVHESQKRSPKVAIVHPVSPVITKEQLPVKAAQTEPTHCCASFLACFCGCFGVCLQQFCLSCSSALN